ncbi:uncharacterized protein PAE49_020622 [Odontesthes bonariensis]
MQGGFVSFAFMSTPGADADQLRKEVEKVVLPRRPDAICVFAPSNNLTSSINHQEAGRAFKLYLEAVREHCTKVFCIGMIPRLTESMEKQELFQQEYHRVSANLKMPFYSIAEDFPLSRVDLWSYDGIHLDDNKGMRILSDRIWVFAHQFLELSAPKPLATSQAAAPYKPRYVPRLVVKGVERVPRPPPPEWTTVRYGRKRSHSGESDSDSPKERVVPDKIATPVLKECYIPLNPVRFSPELLVAMEKVSPLAVADVHTGNEMKPVERLKKPAVLRTRRVRQQVSATPSVTPAAVGVGLVSVKKNVEATSKQVDVCDVVPSPHPREVSDCPGLVSVCPSELVSDREMLEVSVDFECSQTRGSLVYR